MYCHTHTSKLASLFLALDLHTYDTLSFYRIYLRGVDIDCAETMYAFLVIGIFVACGTDLGQGRWAHVEGKTIDRGVEAFSAAYFSILRKYTQYLNNWCNI